MTFICFVPFRWNASHAISSRLCAVAWCYLFTFRERMILPVNKWFIRSLTGISLASRYLSSNSPPVSAVKGNYWSGYHLFELTLLLSLDASQWSMCSFFITFGSLLDSRASRYWTSSWWILTCCDAFVWSEGRNHTWPICDMRLYRSSNVSIDLT